MALNRRLDRAKMWKKFFNFYFIIITSGLLYLILLVTSEPVCYTRVSMDGNNRYMKRVDCNGPEKVCHRFASSEDVKLVALLYSPCAYPEDHPLTHEKHYKGCGEWNEWNGSEYKITSSLQGWEKSRQLCESDNSHLVTIGNKEENEFVGKMVGPCVSYYKGAWTGLNDLLTEGMWEWSNGAVSTYRNWAEGEPDEGEQAKDCVRIHRPTWKWHIFNCKQPRRAVCERNNSITSR